MLSSAGPRWEMFRVLWIVYYVYRSLLVHGHADREDKASLSRLGLVLPSPRVLSHGAPRGNDLVGV